MAYITERRCHRCGFTSRRAANVCSKCAELEREEKQNIKDAEIKALKKFSVKDRLSRIEKWIQDQG